MFNGTIKEYDSFKNWRKIDNFLDRSNLTAFFLAPKTKKISIFFVSVKNEMYLSLTISIYFFWKKVNRTYGIWSFLIWTGLFTTDQVCLEYVSQNYHNLLPAVQKPRQAYCFHRENIINLKKNLSEQAKASL